MSRTEVAPAFQVYAADALADTAAMTHDECGMFWRLAMHAWREQGLPADLPRIARILTLTPKRFQAAWLAIGPAFELREGRYVLPWMEAQRAEQAERRARRSVAGKLGNATRWGSHTDDDAPPDAIAMRPGPESQCDDSAIANDRSVSATASVPANQLPPVPPVGAGAPQPGGADTPPESLRLTLTPPDPVPKGRKAGKTALTPSPEVAAVLDHYRAVHPRAKATGDEPIKAVAARLREGYTVAELCEAIDGNRRDEWSRREKKHEPSWIFKHSANVDRYREIQAAATAPLVGEDGEFTEAGREFFATAGNGARAR